MQTQQKQLPAGLIELTIEVPLEEFKPYLEKAARHLSEQSPVPGFRPGKTPYETVVKHFGEMKIWEEAAVSAAKQTFVKAVRENNLETIGSPKIEILKLAPGNPFVFKAEAAYLPDARLGDFRKIKISERKTEIKEDQINLTLEDLRKMQTKEVVSSEPLGQGGMAKIDMNISVDNVPIEGGQVKGHVIYMDEECYIPGLKEKMLGIKKDEIKKFKLTFPQAHYQKHLAGKEADFQVAAREIYQLEKPPLDDAFAQTLGQESLVKLKNLIKENLEEEQRQKNAQALELELLEKAVGISRFGDIPEILINEEVIKMLHEFKSGLVKQGMDFEAYLKKINKSADQLKIDLSPEAVKRVKAALLLRQIAKEQNIKIEEQDIENETQNVIKLYQDDPETQKNIRSPQAREWLYDFLRNRKALEWLKNTVLSQS